jgi:hypothetical protein
LLPAGPYALYREEQQIAERPGLARMFMYLPSTAGGRWRLEAVQVEPCEIEKAQLQAFEKAD